MAASSAYGSLDDLVTDTLADFARCGVDSLTQFSLLEAAWSHSAPTETPADYVLCLGGAETLASVRSHLEQLVSAGLLRREGECYRLNEDCSEHSTLARLRAFWSDRELHARAAPLLRYHAA